MLESAISRGVEAGYRLTLQGIAKQTETQQLPFDVCQSTLVQSSAVQSLTDLLPSNSITCICTTSQLSNRTIINFEAVGWFLWEVGAVLHCLWRVFLRVRRFSISCAQPCVGHLPVRTCSLFSSSGLFCSFFLGSMRGSLKMFDLFGCRSFGVSLYEGITDFSTYAVRIPVYTKGTGLHSTYLGTYVKVQHDINGLGKQLPHVTTVQITSSCQLSRIQSV